MDENILRKVKAILKSKFYATNDTWLSDCVEYYLSDHDNPNYTEVLDFVVSQWQLSDLREISNETPCLPGNLAQEKCTTLQGHFILQLEKVYDISESKYKQLEKIRNVSNDNIEVTESERTQVWEPKKKRMLHLHLTDGAQNVTAIEYRPIRFLHSNLLPGYKLMIKGPVTCRRGIILLDENNVTEIGGEVENLLVPNALENVLARALNLPENPEPYSDAIQTREPEDALFDDDFDIDMEEVALIETQSQEKASAVSRRDEGIDANPPPVEPASRAIETRREVAETPSVPFDQRTESDLLFDMIDDGIFESATLSSVDAKSTSVSGASSKKTKRFASPRDSEILDDDDPSRFMDEPTTTRSKKVVKPRSTAITPKSSFVEELDDIAMLDIDAVALPQDSTSNSRSTREERIPIVENARPEPYQELNRQSSFESNGIRNSSTVDSRLDIDRTENSENTATKRAPKVATVPSNKSETKKPVETGGKRSASVLSSPIPNQPAGKVRCTKMTPKLDKVNRKITDFLRKDDSSIIAKSNADRVDSISDILSVNGTSKAVGFKTVKARITTMDKLTKSGQCWVLSAAITDPTGVVNVDFSSEILERLLGFTVAEFSQKKKLKKTNPEIEKELREGFRTAERKLMKMNALFKISLAPDKTPKIVEIIETAEEPKNH